MENNIPNCTIPLVEFLKNGGKLEDWPEVKTPKLSDVLNEALGQVDKPIITIAELSGLNNATFHKILKGDMNPTRNTLLRLAFTLELSFEAAQALLKAGNRSQLSGSRDRDQIIMQGIIQGESLGKVCDHLNENGFNDLFAKQD